MKQPLVSAVVTTRNNTATLENCLKSIVGQSYHQIELIVIDNHSTDNTIEIANKYTKKVWVKGPERSAQRNFGASKATGEFVLIIDSDMELTTHVVESAVHKITEDETTQGIIIPEESFGEGFWAACKQLERSYYVGVPWMEAARFFRKSVFTQVSGYNENLVSGEDWDLSQRVEALGRLERIDDFILHNEGKLSLRKTLKKKFYYAQKFALYMDQTKSQNMQSQTGIVARYKLFFNEQKKIVRSPHTWLGMLFMKTAEFGCGGLGYIATRLRKRESAEL
ncbi:MAG TPA: glycosyltransferase [Candidatus Saccharimonadales bacterium]